MHTFDKWLQRKRNERKLRREELAKGLGCCAAMLREIENDAR